MLMPTSALAVAGAGDTINNAKSNFPKSNLFINLPPSSITGLTHAAGFAQMRYIFT
jgi:hypothetical protein